jgi:hypothetical protein
LGHNLAEVLLWNQSFGRIIWLATDERNSEWFPNSGYKFDENEVHYELYDERCMKETERAIEEQILHFAIGKPP